MRKKILLLFMLVSLFVCAVCALDDERETWLRTEQNGVLFDVDYLHRLAEKNPKKASEYYGSTISFAAPLKRVERNVSLDFYGAQEIILVFAVSDKRQIIVDGSALEESCETGDVLKVQGKLTAIRDNCLYMLNSYGCPGFPNRISIERLK